ncbi:sel1 repeat family protein [Grimontia kaedaensis]|uniref:Sel1 repeat family protein n=1 Tax=Grimontia kaedaensis TaxID=2872157 RepID=A0ABY4WVR3_9GAMM|nr:tetratricopeptide repeat protein [Grimontia kaedaensis]USH03455.1 sel1 repeat family protein [Grimontia kaedaensis]
MIATNHHIDKQLTSIIKIRYGYWNMNDLTKEEIMLSVIRCIFFPLFLSLLIGCQSKLATNDKNQQHSFFEMAKRGAELGDPVDQYFLANMYQEGRNGLTPNTYKAKHWYEKSAIQGNARAQNNLGRIYEAGLGTNVDNTKAYYWYNLSAQQGHRIALYNLASLYLNGKGVKSDKEKARHYFELSAKKKFSNAQHNLGVLYENGDGVEQNYKLAFAWYSAARTFDPRVQESLDRLTVKIGDEIDEAKIFASSYIIKFGKEK